jgi:hypothetical protein
MARDYTKEAERNRGLLSLQGVTPQMIEDAPNVAMADSLLPMPLSPIEKMIERDGKGKTFGKMLLGGMTGLTPFLMPELIGGNARYKAELEHYYDQVEQRREDAMLNGINMGNPTIADIANLPTPLQDLGASNYQGNQGGYMAQQAQLAGMSYTDFMSLSPETRRWHIRRNASEADRADMDFVAGRQTPEQKAEEAAAITSATERAKLDTAAEVTEESRMPQLQDAFDITMQLLDDESYRGLYGAIDGRTPTVLPESLNAKAKLDRLSNILYMFARGELKGQGQVTEQEAEAARSAQSMITDFLQSDDQTEEELKRLNRKFGEILGIKPEDMWHPRDERDRSINDLVEQYTR